MIKDNKSNDTVFVSWEYVMYSNVDIDDAFTIFNRRQEWLYYIWKSLNWKHILEDKIGNIEISKFVYKIPKDVVPQDLNLATCFEIVRIQDEKPAAPKRGRYAKKK